jgi:hypothetical protein
MNRLERPAYSPPLPQLTSSLFLLNAFQLAHRSFWTDALNTNPRLQLSATHTKRLPNSLPLQHFLYSSASLFSVHLTTILFWLIYKNRHSTYGALYPMRHQQGWRPAWQKTKKFSGFFSKILIFNISASKPSIEKPWKQFEEMVYTIILKQLHYF